MAQSRRDLASAVAAFTGLMSLFFAHAALSQQGLWKPLTSMPTPRRLLAAAADGENIYTFGGCGSPCFEPPLHTSTFEETRVEVYNTRDDSWQVKHPMSAILFGAAAAAVPEKKKIYTFGGYVTGNLTQEYDIATEAWTKKRSMPTPRFGLAAVAVKGKIYVLGGSDGKGPSDALEIYNPNNDTWMQGARMPTARVFLAATVLDKKIYAIGGSPDCCGKSQTNVVEIYDTVAKTWTTGAPLLVAEQTSAAASVNGKIYVFGGFIPGAGTQNTTFEYDQGSWSRKADMPTPRDQAPAVAVDGLVYVIGGAVNCHCSALGENEQYTPQKTPSVDLSLTKSDFRTTVCVGDSTSYTIVVQNKGPDPVTGAAVTDTLPDNLGDVHWFCDVPGGGSCTAPDKLPLVGSVSLPAGKKARFFVTGTVSGGKTLSNTATVMAAEDTVTSNNSKTDTDTISTKDFELAVEKPSATCTSFSYTLAITNLGLATDSTVATALIPPGLLPSVPPADSRCWNEPDEILCDSDSVAAGATTKIPIVFEIPECYAGTNPVVAVASLEPDCNPANNQVSVSLPVVCKADLAIEKTGPVCVNPGSPYSYSLKVTNLGPDCACNTQVIDSNPRNFVSETLPSWCKDEEGRLVACAIGKLCLGDLPRTFQLDFTLSPTAPIGTLVNTATVADASGTMDPDRSNNSAMTTALVPCCSLTITKTVDATMAMPGQIRHYTIVASHPFGEDVTATVDDPFPAGLIKIRWCRDTTPIPCTPNISGDIHKPISLPAGGSETFRAQGIVDIKFTGKLSNTASVSAPGCIGASATVETDISFTGVKAFCTEISGQFITGSMISKKFVLINGGPFNQADNPGDEFTDTLPPGLTLTGVSADSGTPAMVGNTATWNGAIPVSGMVMITITATITAPAGTTLCNQATVFFDADGDGINESNGLSDDPDVPGDADPCCFLVGVGIPTLTAAGLAALALLLAGFAVLRLRGRRRADPGAERSR